MDLILKEIVQFETELLRKDPTKELLVAAILIIWHPSNLLKTS